MYTENNVIKLFQKMEVELEKCIPDAEKFVEGNSSAGTRVGHEMEGGRAATRDGKET